MAQQAQPEANRLQRLYRVKAKADTETGVAATSFVKIRDKRLRNDPTMTAPQLAVLDDQKPDSSDTTRGWFRYSVANCQVIYT